MRNRYAKRGRGGGATGRSRHDESREGTASSPHTRGDTAKSADICTGGLGNSCGRQVKDEDDALECESCHTWFHIQCQNVDRAKYKAIEDLGGEVTWYCSECKITVPKVLDSISNLARKLDTLQDDIGQIKDRINVLESRVSPDIDSFRDSISRECKELFLREAENAKRQNNVVIFGLNQPTGVTQEDRVNEDKARILSIFKDELGLPDIKVTKAIRLLPRVPNPTSNKPPPTKVVLSCHADRITILQNAKKLANPKSPQNSVFIAPDLSKEERELNKKLRTELWSKRNASQAAQENCKWVIRNNKVIKIPELPGNSQASSL